MGCSASKVEAYDQVAQQQNDVIEKQIKQDRKEDQRTVKILLLGMQDCLHTLSHVTD